MMKIYLIYDIINNKKRGDKMSTIIPYDEKLGEGAFITPKNEIKMVYDCHESFAYNFCCENYKYLNELKFNNEDTCFNKLSKEQLKLCKLWLEKYDGSNSYSDFLVFVLGFDKIQTVMNKSITTTSFFPHIKYYNYYLMDWYVEQLTPMKYNNETGLFEPKNQGMFFGYSTDRDAEEEINEIKSKVLKSDRPYFFK